MQGQWLSVGWKILVLSLSLLPFARAHAQPKDILFVSTSQGLMQINPDGTGLTPLNLNGQAPRWSPNGTKFAFLKFTGRSFLFELFVADADGSNLRSLNTNVGWTTYQWSPDGTRIAFLSNGDFESGFELFAVNADGTNLQSLGVRVGTTSSALTPFVWTPDGAQILFVAPSGQLHYVRVSDKTVTPLPLQGEELAFHPLGSFFIFVGHRGDPDAKELFVANADGTSVRPLNLRGEHPILSPNGQFLLFVTESEQAFVQELSPTGDPVGNPVPLNVIVPEGAFATWSPDSAKLVLTVQGSINLAVINRDGTGLTLLNVEGFEPQWRPLPRVQLTVTTDADSGPGSLRNAITQANASPSPVFIRFARPMTIRLQTPLPPLNNVNGFTITIIGDVDGDGNPDVVIDGSGLPRSRQPADGLTILTAGNIVDGITLQAFPGNGIVITGSAATNNTVRNCFVQNNGANGILISNGASDNLVTGCFIHMNGGDGIRVEGNASVRNRFTANRHIGHNGRLGINLVGGTEDASGVTANDAGDTDTGPNTLQNFPDLISAVNFSGNVLVQGRIDTPNPTTVTIEFYGNDAADPSGFGEGERFLGTTTPGSDGRFSVSVTGVSEGQFVTAIAIDADGNTSEFSRAVMVTPPPPAPQLLAPIGGAVVSTMPLFRLKAPTATGLGRVQFRIELSQDNFATVARTIEPGVANGWNKDDYAPDEEAVAQVPLAAPLPSGNWQWRAETIDITRQVKSDFSAVQTFTAVPPPPPPNLLEPSDNAIVSVTPSFKVQGSLPANDPSRLVYFLELSQDNFATIARTIEPGTANGWDKADYGPDEVATLTLPTPPLTEGTWQWRVRAALATQPTVQSAPSEIRSFTALDNRDKIPAGVSLVGLPFIPTNPTRQGLGLASDTRVAVYDPTVSPTPYRYDADAEPLPIAEGRAFWVKSMSAQSPQVSGTLFSFPVVVNLVQGWNAIGNPLPSPLVWKFTAPTAVHIRQETQEFTLEDAIRKGLVSAFVWVWNETANNYNLVYDPSILPAQSGDPFRNDIPAWRGFWIYANVANLQLVIDQSPRFAPLANRQARSAASADGVVLALSVHKKGQVIGTALVGVRPDLPTRLTVPPPPPAPNGGSNGLLLDGGNSADIRPDKRRQVWTVQVNDGEELTWSGLIPRGWRALLVDPATNTQRSLRSNARLQVQAGQRLLLIVEPDTGQPLRIVNLQAQPLRGRGVQISFVLTAPAQATVTIMTLTGRKIVVLESTTRSVGTHRFFWQGVSSDGHSVPPGVYLVRVQATDETGRQAQATRTVMWR